MQASSILFRTFEAPLVLAWAFEITPEGMKSTEAFSPDEKLPYRSKG
jgi:hypothetical protein